MQDLDGLKFERLDTVEDPLAGAEQDRRDVERELVDDPGNEGLTDGRGATRDVYAALAGRLTRLCVSGVVGALVAEMPAMELAPTLAEWILAALVGPSDVAVERDRHVAGGVRHRRPLGLVCDLQVATAPLEPPPSHRIVKPPATPGFRAFRHSALHARGS